MQDTQVGSLGRGDLLEKEMATHSSTLAWEIPWTEELWRAIHGVAKSRTRLSIEHCHFHKYGQGCDGTRLASRFFLCPGNTRQLWDCLERQAEWL